MSTNERRLRRERRRARVRKTVRGSQKAPRLCVFRSPRHIYAQVISDEEGRTLVSVSTLGTDFKKSLPSGGNIAAASAIGELIARRCIENSILEVVFDRNGFLYHGRVKALADAAREAGLKF